MSIRAALLAWLAPMVLAPAPDCKETGSTKMENLRAEHPRLLLVAGDWQEIRARIRSDPRATQWHAELTRKAGKLLGEPPVVHKLEGPRLLRQSRNALDRISLLAGLYLLDGNKQYAERARKEMLAAAAFPDWNPSHFLDTAEMSAALGLGYDWLFGFLSAEDKSAVRGAIVQKGLRPGLEAIEKGAWWAKSAYNWNQVCHGGLTVGALAIAEDEPALAERMVRHAVAGVPRAMASFKPDGGWGEGPGYWGYTTQYTVYLIAALESALGSDFGLKSSPGFSEAGFFRMHTTGPTGRCYNFADAGASAGKAPQMFWLARAFGQPAFAAHELAVAGQRGDQWQLFWGAGAAGPQDLAAAPTDAVFRGVHVALFRSAWNDDQAFFVGFKGGDNAVNHGHLDLGSFVLDALGKRWAEDLGRDDYNLPAYFGAQRWTYYRLRTEGHNTLMLGGENQNTKAVAPIVAFLSSPARSFAVADLSAAYQPKARKVFRGVALLNKQRVLVQDEFEFSQPAELIWQMHTLAKVETKEGMALLSSDSARLAARILAPAGARFEVAQVKVPPPQKELSGVSKLVVRLPQAASGRLAVVFTRPEASALPLPLEPLEKWIADAARSEGSKPRASTTDRQ